MRFINKYFFFHLILMSNRSSSEEMILQTMDSDDISSALERYRNVIDSKEDAEHFMREEKLNKDNSLRLISWLVAFDIIPEREFNRPREISRLIKTYEEETTTIFGNFYNDPTKILEPKVGNVIIADISRSINHFYRMAEELKLPQTYTEDAYLHIVRLLSYIHYLSLKNNRRGMRYVQGFDRYSIICYLLSLQFAYNNTLSTIFAEVITFHLCPKLISLAQLQNFLDDVPATTNRYQRMNIALEKTMPEVMAQLRMSGSDSFHFALMWEIIMFADEYPPLQIFLLWDQFIVNKDNYKEFSFNLCIAHVEQAPKIPNPDSSLLETIQNYKDWKLKDAIDRAYDLTYPKSVPSFILNTNSKYIFTILFIILFLYLAFQQLIS